MDAWTTPPSTASALSDPVAVRSVNRSLLVASSIERAVCVAVAGARGANSARMVPAAALNHGVRVLMVATSRARATVEPTVTIAEVAKLPSSRLTYCTLPDTVSVSEPAVGVKVSETRFAGPGPTSGPAVDVPGRVIVPVPQNDSV